MPNNTDVIRGALKLDSFLEDKCFTNWESFILSIPTMFSVEVPAGITNVNVGNSQPTDDERDNLWVRKDNSGSFLGFYVYSQGAWRNIYPPPNGPILVVGDSRTIPDGYQLASDSPLITASMLTKLRTLWVLGGTLPDWYTMFHVMYVGF